MWSNLSNQVEVVEKEYLETKVKTLVCDFEKSNDQFCSFSSRSKKFDNLLRLNKPARNMKALGCNETSSYIATSSKIMFASTSNKPKSVGVLG